MKATVKQMERMAEEVSDVTSDIAELQSGASLKKMGVPSGVSREEAIAGWTQRKTAIEAKMAAGEWFPM